MRVPNIYSSLKVEPLFIGDKKVEYLFALYIRNKIFYMSYGDLVAFSVDRTNMNKSSTSLDASKASCYMNDNIDERNFASLHEHKKAIIEHNGMIHILSNKVFVKAVKHLIKLSCVISSVTGLKGNILSTINRLE